MTVPGPYSRARRIGRKRRLAAEPDPHTVLTPGMQGERYKPLTDGEIARLHRTSLDILEQIGIADATPEWRERVVAAGGWESEDGRLCFPRSLVEDTIASAARNYTLHGRDPRHDMEITGNRTYFAGATANIRVLDHETGAFRDSTLKDLYDMVRIADALDNVHFVQRPIIARDLDGDDVLDINTAYATTAATSKHITTTIFRPSTLERIVSLYDISVGGDGSGDSFRRRPFASTTTTIAVSPLRYAQDSCRTADAAVLNGIPLKVATAPQAGATAPASIAGTVALGNAEVLSGFVALNLLKPGCTLFHGNWAFVSDLRTGAFAGGGGEMALLNAAQAQLTRFYDLPSSVVAGMTSAKLPDIQSGWEKGYLTALVGQSGANMITMAMGGLADNIAYSAEALVIDESLLSGVLRCVSGIEVTEETLALASIRNAISGDKHFLNDAMTLERMKTEFVYPEFADRQSIDAWNEAGATDIREVAREKVRRLLAEHWPDHIAPADDARIRDAFPIRLPRPGPAPD